MSNRFTEKAEKVLNVAVKTAEEYGHSYIGSEHLLISLCQDSLSCSYAILTKCGVEKTRIDEGIKEYSGVGSKTRLSSKDMTPGCRKIIETSYKNAIKYSSQKIGTEHILLALIKDLDNVAIRLLNTMGVSTQRIYIDLLIAMGEDGNLYKTDLAKSKNKGKQKTTLEQYSRDLTHLAKIVKIDA